MLGKLLGMATVSSSLVSLGAMRRFLSGLATIMVLTIVSAFMLCILLASALGLISFCWVRAGADPVLVGVSLGAIVLLTTAGCLGFAVCEFKKMRDLSARWFDKKQSRWPDPTVVVDAFIDGLLNHKK